MQLLRLETTRKVQVASRLRSLPTGDLEGPAIGDWSIREVIAHLVVVADFSVGNVAGLSEDQLDLPGYHPGGLLPLNRFLLLRAKELCMHEWDMCAPNDASARISELGVAAVLQIIDENIASGSLRWAYRPDAGIAKPFHVAVELDEPLCWSAAFTVTTDSVDMHDVDADDGDLPSTESPTRGPTDGTITGDAEAFVRVVYGRLDPVTAAETGALTSVPPELAGRFGRWFTGI